MKPKYLAIINLAALALLFTDFIPYNREISAVLIIIVSMLLLFK